MFKVKLGSPPDVIKVLCLWCCFAERHVTFVQGTVNPTVVLQSRNSYMTTTNIVLFFDRLYNVAIRFILPVIISTGTSLLQGHYGFHSFPVVD